MLDFIKITFACLLAIIVTVVTFYFLLKKVFFNTCDTVLEEEPQIIFRNCAVLLISVYGQPHFQQICDASMYEEYGLIILLTQYMELPELEPTIIFYKDLHVEMRSDGLWYMALSE
jgi:hypothetical protein